MSISDYLTDGQDYLIDGCSFLECEHCECKEECDEYYG